MDGIADWWDSAELWLAQLWFPAQFALIMVVLVPLCLGVAWLIDRIVVAASAGIARLRRPDDAGDGAS